MNLWVVLYEAYRDKKKNIQKAPIEFGGNEELKQFYNEYRNLAVKYIIQKNIFVLVVIGLSWKLAKGMSYKIAKFLSGIKNDVSNAMVRQQLRY